MLPDARRSDGCSVIIAGEKKRSGSISKNICEESGFVGLCGNLRGDVIGK